MPGLSLLRDALQRVGAEITVVELSLQQRLGRGGDHDAVGRREALQARGKIDGFTDSGVALFGALPNEIADHDEAGRDPDADGRRMAERTTRLDRAGGRQHPHDLEPGAHRALGIVLMRGRIAEIDQNAIADEAGGKTFVMLHNADAGFAEARDHVAHVFRVELHRERSGIHHVTKHGGELTPLGADLGPGLRASRRVGLLRSLGPEQRGRGPLEPLAIAQRQAEFDQIGLGQICHDIEIEAMPREEIGVVTKTDAFEPVLQPAFRPRTRFILQHGDSARPSFRRRALGPSITDFGGPNFTSDWTRSLGSTKNSPIRSKGNGIVGHCIRAGEGSAETEISPRIGGVLDFCARRTPAAPPSSRRAGWPSESLDLPDIAVQSIGDIAREGQPVLPIDQIWLCHRCSRSVRRNLRFMQFQESCSIGLWSTSGWPNSSHCWGRPSSDPTRSLADCSTAGRHDRLFRTGQ